MRRVDDRLVDLGGHLPGGAEVVVDADLDEVDVHVGRRVHPLGRLLRRVGDDDRTGDADARVLQVGTLAVAHGDGFRSVAAEAGDRGDAVARIQRELVHHVLFGVEGGVGLEPAHVVDVPVGVDQPRGHRLAAKIHRGGVFGHRDRVARSDRLDHAVPDHDRTALDGLAVADDQARAGEGGQPRRRLDLLRLAAARGGSGEQGEGQRYRCATVQTLHLFYLPPAVSCRLNRTFTKGPAGPCRQPSGRHGSNAIPRSANANQFSSPCSSSITSPSRWISSP